MFKVDIEKLPSFQIGFKQGVERTAKKLLSSNSDIAFIVDVTGLSIKDIQELEENQIKKSKEI